MNKVINNEEHSFSGLTHFLLHLGINKKRHYQNAKNWTATRRTLKPKMPMSQRLVKMPAHSFWYRCYISTLLIKVEQFSWWIVVRLKHILNRKLTLQTWSTFRMKTSAMGMLILFHDKNQNLAITTVAITHSKWWETQNLMNILKFPDSRPIDCLGNFRRMIECCGINVAKWTRLF